ncbi:MAG: sugar phosphate isomerase/epimerase family protein [Verrucomicrobiota bacterium]
MARSLLSLFPAASALLAFRANGAPVPQPAFTEAGFSIAVQCWSFKEFTLFEAIEMAAATGAGGIEPYPGQKLGGPHGSATFSPDMPAEKLRAVADYLTKHHLAAVNLGVIDIPKDETAARRIFEFAKSLGLYGLTTESLGSLDTLEKLAAEHDIKVCFHNHPKPTALWHPDTLWKAIEDRHPNIGYCADIGHWASSGLDPLEVIQQIAPRVHAFHLKDRASIEEPSRDQPLGTGIIAIPAILDEVRKHGFAGNVTIEYEYNWQTNLAEISQCVGYLRAYSKLRL